MNALSELKKRLFTRSGRPRVGALSRASEHIGVMRSTIRNWYLPANHPRKWHPGKATIERIAEVLRDEKVTWEPKKRGPKGPRSASLKKVFSRVKA